VLTGRYERLKNSTAISDVAIRSDIAAARACNGLLYLHGPSTDGIGKRLYEYDDKSTVGLVITLLCDRKKSVPLSALKLALSHMCNRAKYDTSYEQVSIRMAERSDAMFVDLGNGSVVKATAAGWEVVSDSGCLFHRPQSALALAASVRGGHAEELKDVLQLDDDRWHLVLGWMLGALKECGHHFALVVQGD
jgi:hypothetical protein